MKKLLMLLSLIIICGCQKVNKTPTGEVEEKVNINTIENLNVEIYSNVKLSSLIENNDEIKIVNGDDLIDTSKLGEKEIVLKYYDKKEKENYYSFKIKIVDTQAPKIECSDKITTDIGKQIDLLKSAKVTDNSKEDINVTVSGKYDYSKAGEYKLKFLAQDSSGNKTEKNFTLVVQGYKLKTSGYYIYKMPDTWIGLYFQKNGNASWLPWWCPGFGCGGGGAMYGKYTISGNTITAKFTETIEDTGEKYKINVVYKYKLSNNETIVDEKNNKYKWQKNFG